MYIFLQPEDVLLFRDGRPFNQGEDHHARSVFPPLPSVMQGAIRSHYLVIQGIPLDDKKRIIETVGTAEDYKALRLRGPFLSKRQSEGVTRYFPTPADAFVLKKEAGIILPATLQPNSGMNSHTHLPYLLCKPQRVPRTKDKPDAWLSEAQLKNYLVDGTEAQTTPENVLFVRETRLGIQLDHWSRTSKDEMLYQAEFIRPMDEIGLSLEVKGYPNWPSSGLMRIGGEGHGVYFLEVGAPKDVFPCPKTLWMRFKVYFATPAYFNAGWQPHDWGEFFEGNVTLQAAAISGSLVASGFDYARKQEKPARRYVPAGSVYYFSCKGQARLKTDAISQYGAEIGFGQIFVTEWKER